MWLDQGPYVWEVSWIRELIQINILSLTLTQTDDSSGTAELQPGGWALLLGFRQAVAELWNKLW